jgi:sec-independent protein translocase protein TatB
VFDIGFGELVICLVVALVVIGPEQLPGTVRTVGLWIGRLKRSLRETRSEIERQIGADDIRRQLHNEEILQNIEATRRQFQNSIDESANAVQSSLSIEQQADAQARLERSGHHYGSPQELPDHAHTQGAPASASADTVTTDATTADKPITPQAPTGTGN